MRFCFFLSILLICGCWGDVKPSAAKPSTPKAAQKSIFARVVGVHDGDSCRAVIDGKETPIRLEGIDAPELGQPFGKNAKQQLSDLIFGQVVEIIPTGRDRYRRTLAHVRAGGKSVNQEMILRGFAWHFLTYNRDPALAKAEQVARSAKRGLWAAPAPIPPWEWRKTPKQGAKDTP